MAEVNGVTITVEVGDIARVPADAVVNAANTELWMGAGVAGALKRAGGEEIEREAVAKGPIPLGEAVATTAGRLPARYVIHAAGMEPGRPATAESIRRATRRSLELADQLGLSSIVLPAIGTGVGGFSLEEAGQIMAEEAVALARGGRLQHLRQIRFILLDDAARSRFAEGAARAGLTL